MTISILNDQSNKFGIARDQGERPTCLVFASSDLHQHSHQHNDYFSVEYLCHHAHLCTPGWDPTQGFPVSSVVQAIENPGQPLDSLYPYVPDNHHQPFTPPHISPALFTQSNSTGPITPLTLMALLGVGQPAVIVIRITDTFVKPDQGIVAFSNMVYPGLHAVIAVGIGTHSGTNETHVLIRNSWGTSWGNQGYAWLPERYLHLHMTEGFHF